MSTIFSTWLIGTLCCLSDFKSHFQIIPSKLRKNWTGIIFQLSLLQLVGLLTFPTLSGLRLVQIPEKDFLLGQANHHNPCLGRSLKNWQLIDPWSCSALLVIGFRAHSGPVVLLLGWTEAWNRSTLCLSSVTGMGRFAIDRWRYGRNQDLSVL